MRRRKYFLFDIQREIISIQRKIAVRLIWSRPFRRLHYTDNNGFASRVFRRFLFYILNRIRTFDGTGSLSVSISYNCNLSCKACYAKGLSEEFPYDMEVDDFEKLVLWAKRNNYRRIRFLGGEPTTSENFVDMLRVCHEHNMQIAAATNNLFPSNILDALLKYNVAYLSLNYNVFVDSNSSTVKKVFKNNVRGLMSGGILFDLSYIIDRHNSIHKDKIKKIEEDLRFFKPLYLRISLELPDYSNCFSFDLSDFLKGQDIFLANLHDVLWVAFRNSIPVYMYRALPMCIFPVDYAQSIKKRFPLVTFSRCFLGYGGDFSNMLVINPDLSFFPCASIFMKGSNILDFPSRHNVSEFFHDKIIQLLKKPLSPMCETCSLYKKYHDFLGHYISNKERNLFGMDICQGGCLRFKINGSYACF